MVEAERMVGLIRAFSEKVESEKCSFGDSQVPANMIHIKLRTGTRAPA
jgi:hypothetical protein